ncbi:MAG: polysaccharide deacetylase family protein [Gammaproteobacteria bacterium]
MLWDKKLPISVIFMCFGLSTGSLAQENANNYSSGTVVAYHHVATDTPPSTTISPANFRRHLEYLRDNDFHVMPLNQMVEALRKGESIPDRAVAITFDDGYISIYETAFPMLQEFDMPFTLFLSTGPIDQGLSGYMNWDQIKEMSDAGVLIANHMVTHPYMLEREQGESESAWLNKLRAELLEAESAIELHTGRSHRYLAYPYGEFNPAIKQMLAEEGFTGFAQNSGAIGPNSDYLALPRFPLASIYANLDTAKIKFDALAFNASTVEPSSPVTSQASPSVTLRFNPGPYNFSQIGCFANSQPMEMEWLDRSSGLVEISTDQQFNGRRWRYICTAPAPGTNRYYWYSVQWINPDRGE